MVCEIHFCCILWFRRMYEISHNVRNCPSLSPTAAPPLDFACYAKFLHRHAKLLHIGFLPLTFFLASLIGLATYCQAWKPIAKLGKWLWSAPKHGFFMYLSFNLHCHGLHKILPHSLFVSMIQKLVCFNDPKATKNTKTSQKLISNPC